MIKVTIWNEFVHENIEEIVKNVYPKGIHNCIADFLKSDEVTIRTATLDMPEHGLTDEVLKDTDVLIWWGHMAHEKVSDEVAKKVQECVLKGMGLIVLHSGHHSKPFKLLMGTTCNLSWGEDAKERVWCCNPAHPIAEGIPSYFELPSEEMYGEFFDVGKADDTVFLGWFKSGQVFRSGLTFTRGCGKIFYFQPGHESNPIFYNENVQKIIKNAVYWAKPTIFIDKLECLQSPSLEK